MELKRGYQAPGQAAYEESDEQLGGDEADAKAKAVGVGDVFSARPDDIRQEIVTEAGGWGVFGFGSSVHGWRLPIILLMVAYFALAMDFSG